MKLFCDKKIRFRVETRLLVVSYTLVVSFTFLAAQDVITNQTLAKPKPSLVAESISDTCLQNLNSNQKIEDNQLEVSWRWKYVEEQAKDSVLEKLEDSVDERLANINHAFTSTIVAISDIYELDIHPNLNHLLELTAGEAVGVDDDLCGEQLSEFISLTEELELIVDEKRMKPNETSRTLGEKHLRLAHVLDSYGKYDAGLLAGRSLFLGSHTQCVDSQLRLRDQDPLVDMRYCMAKVRVDKHLHQALRSLQRSRSNPDTVLSVAICLPKSCHTKSFRKHKSLLKKLVDSQFKLPRSIYVDEILDLSSVFCLLDDSPLARIPISGYLLMLLLIVWLCLTVYATFSKSRHDKSVGSWQRHIFRSLDLRSSWADFSVSNKTPITVDTSRVNLDTLNPVKVLGCMFVVYGHGLMVHMFGCVNGLKAYSDMENDPVATLLSSLTVVVDSFFVITGIMLGFIGMKKIRNPHGNENILSWFAKQSFKLAAARYLRLVPLYFLVFWFKKSIFMYLGSGPTWDYGYNQRTLVGSCRLESWLSPFTTQAAFRSLSKQCIPQAWSVANDIFFSITLAPLIILILRRPRIAVALALFICVASNMSMFNAYSSIEPALKNDLRDLRFHAFAQMFNDLTFLYTSPYYRVFSMLIGILAGYVLYHYEQSSKLQKWPGWFAGLATKLSFVNLVLVVIVPLMVPILRKDFLVRYPIHHNLFEHSMTTSRLIWSASNAVIFLRMVTDWKDNFMMQKSAGTIWKTLVRLNYPILLIHFDVLLFGLMSQSTIEMFSRYQTLALFGSAYMASSFIGSLLHILIENPIDKLVKSLWKGLGTSEKSEKNLKEE